MARVSPAGGRPLVLATIVTIVVAALLIASALLHGAPAGAGALGGGLHFLCQL